MIKNYLITAYRNLIRNKGFSFINILGLAIGMVASILISLWAYDELSFDGFHEKSNKIFRVERDLFFNGERYLVPVTGAIYGGTIKSDFPEYEDMLRLYASELSVEDQSNTDHQERVFFGDDSFFNVFSFDLLRGDPSLALKEPFSVVLTQKGAERYFGKDDPINKQILIEWEGEKRSYLVTGIMQNIPQNSHFHFDVLASFNTLETFMPENLKSWLNNYLYTYVLLKDDITVEQAEDKLQVLVDKYILPAYSQFLRADDTESSMKLYLRSIEDIHLCELMWGIEPSGSESSVYIFSIVAILILIIACFNFMNLSTAMAGKRSLEVGVRKTMGAKKKQLVLQFLGESFFISILAFIIALVIIEFILPFYNTFANKSLSLLSLGNTQNLILLASIIVVTGIFAGLYPAFYLSSFKPIAVLKGRSRGSSGNFNFRQILVVLQFAISIMLIIGTMTAYLQMQYFQNKPLGFSKENMLVIPVESNNVREHYQVFRNDILQLPIVEKVGSSSKIPTNASYSDSGFETVLLAGETFLSKYYSIDYDYFDCYNISFVAGRNFSKEYSSDVDASKYIINESAMHKMGIKNPDQIIGKQFDYMGSENKNGKIIGVVKDYHYQGLDKQIEPMVHFLDVDSPSFISVKYTEGNDKEIAVLLEQKWKAHFPGVVFSSNFMEERYDNLYVNETRMQTTLIAFTILALFVACLGLFGLATFIAQQKTREIGIRKAHGASTGSIVNLLNQVFVKWVLIATILACPIAYYFLDEWLANFYYRIDLPIWVFVVSGCIGFVIAIITVSYQSFKAARLNPVDALRYE